MRITIEMAMEINRTTKWVDAPGASFAVVKVSRGVWEGMEITRAQDSRFGSVDICCNTLGQTVHLTSNEVKESEAVVASAA